MATRLGADKSHGPRLQARKGTKGRPSKGSKRTTGAAGGREDDSTDSLRAVIMPWELRAEERHVARDDEHAVRRLVVRYRATQIRDDRPRRVY